MRPAVLVILKKNQIVRVIQFESHEDALIAADRFSDAGFWWAMHQPEHVAAGDVPEDMPSRQLELF